MDGLTRRQPTGAGNEAISVAGERVRSAPAQDRALDSRTTPAVRSRLLRLPALRPHPTQRRLLHLPPEGERNPLIVAQDRRSVKVVGEPAALGYPRPADAPGPGRDERGHVYAAYIRREPFAGDDNNATSAVFVGFRRR